MSAAEARLAAIRPLRAPEIRQVVAFDVSVLHLQDACLVFRVVSHWLRQSLSCARLRRNHVFTVDTGRLTRAAISSLVIP